MDRVTFGLTMMVVGMGGTLVTLWILSMVMNLLKKAFPHKEENQREGSPREGAP